MRDSGLSQRRTKAALLSEGSMPGQCTSLRTAPRRALGRDFNNYGSQTKGSANFKAKLKFMKLKPFRCQIRVCEGSNNPRPYKTEVSKIPL